jgi:hypothetical protein
VYAMLDDTTVSGTLPLLAIPSDKQAILAVRRLC